MNKNIEHILVIRFRQIGDAVLAVALCSTLKKTFPAAKIDLVLNKSIAPLLKGHPDIDRIITFDPKENSDLCTYVGKVRRVMRQTRYDVIIDMRSTLRTLLFSLFSLHTPFRIGRRKWYNHLLQNQRIDYYNPDLVMDMVQRNRMLVEPLQVVAPIVTVPEFRLFVTEEERAAVRAFMAGEGINFRKPIVLVSVTAKLDHKRWSVERMTEVIRRMIELYAPQVIFNYAPGKEEDEAFQVYRALKEDRHVFIDLRTRSLRELAALCSMTTFFFGNEGGPRHIAHSMGVPSYVIFSPKINKQQWLPVNEVPAAGICTKDLCSPEEIRSLSYQEQYDRITVEDVWRELDPMLNRYLKV